MLRLLFVLRADTLMYADAVKEISAKRGLLEPWHMGSVGARHRAAANHCVTLPKVSE
jgi:hypothetical protein